MSHQRDLMKHLIPPILMLFILACICSSGGLSSEVRQGIEVYEACDPMTAKDLFNTAIENDDEDAAAYYQRGIINYETGYYEDAVEDFTNAIEFEPENMKAFYYRGLCYQKLEEEDQAEDDFETALDGFDQKIEDEPEEAEWYLWRGDVNANGLDEQDDALEDYDKAIELDPEFARAYNHRGAVTYTSTDEWQDALDDLNTVLNFEEAPCYEKAYAFNYRGLIKDAKLDDQDAAVEDYEQAIEANPYYVSAHYNLGASNFENGEYEESIDYFDDALEINPNYAAAYNYRGLSYYKTGDYEAAIEDYSKAMELSPDWSVPIKNRGQAYYNNDEYELAIPDLTHYLTLKPEDTSALNLLGLVYSELENYDSAIEKYSKAIELDPNYVWPYYNRALANRDAGNTAAAVADFTQFLNLYEKEDDYSATAEEYLENNTGAMITEVFFSSDIDANSNPINILETFPSGTVHLYAFVTFMGMTDGAPFESVWRFNGEELIRTPFDWDMGESGTGWAGAISYSSGDPLDPGTYQWELYYNSTLLAMSETTIQ